MDYVLILIVAVGLVIWYIRPIYNFMAKRKYLLLDTEKLSFSRRLQTWLPSIVFFSLLFAFIFLPAIITDRFTGTETGGIFVVQVLFIFVLSRYDKWQTKYVVKPEYLQFRKRKIKWDEPYSIKFKKSAFFILHKPRFILASKTTKIVVPMLSHGFEDFINRISFTNEQVGFHLREIYENTRAYYVDNIDLQKQLNKEGKKVQ